MRAGPAITWLSAVSNHFRPLIASLQSFAHLDERKVQPASMIMKAEGPSGRAKIRSDNPKQGLGPAQYLRSIGYSAWIEDGNGNAIDKKALKMAMRSHHEDAPAS
jgi:hypothetical protein